MNTKSTVILCVFLACLPLCGYGQGKKKAKTPESVAYQELGKVGGRYDVATGHLSLGGVDKLNKFTSIGIYNLSVTDKTITYIKDLPNIVRLDLHGSLITDEGMSSLSELTKLESLDLSFTRITDAGLVHISELTNLKHLALHAIDKAFSADLKPQLTDAGIAQLKNLKNLESLSLYGAKITDASLDQIKAFTKLKSLTLRDTNVTYLGVKKMERAMPDLLITAEPKIPSPN